jgi:hypothetical protein
MLNLSSVINMERIYDMNSREKFIRHNVEHGIPSMNVIDDTAAHELDVYIKDAEEASLLAHAALYDSLSDGNPNVITFTDEQDKPDKYVSFAGRDGQPLFGPWNPEQPASDIGIRGANPNFHGILNPTTVIHADTLAVAEFQQNGAPQEVIDAIAAVAKLNAHVEDAIAKPYLAAVGRAYGIDPETYLANFFAQERGRREQILTRVIMYHLVAAPGQRPVGSDGTPLLIKEHADKSSWTFDIHQTGPGLQYRVNKQWQNAGTSVAAFRGAADSYLPAKTPATLHRAVMREHEPAEHLRRVGIGRVAVPMFISPIHEDAHVVASNSVETHPTELIK